MARITLWGSACDDLQCSAILCGVQRCAVVLHGALLTVICGALRVLCSTMLDDVLWGLIIRAVCAVLCGVWRCSAGLYDALRFTAGLCDALRCYRFVD